MNKKSRLVRVFISSTFSDMAHERRILHEHVFPELTRLCASRGARFQAVDLRWGVNEESQLDHKTMDLCLGEIERCQRFSPKPNFLVLLGDRYGWEPVPARILSDEFEELRGHASDQQGGLLERWYVRDDNAVPVHYVMKRRDEDFDEYHEWAPEEKKLLKTLRDLVNKTGLKGEARDKYFQSATHQEIVRGALSAPTVPENTIDPGEHVLACFRAIEGLPQEPNTFFDDRSAELDALQAELRSRLAETDDSTDNVYGYNAAWQPADQDDIALEDESAFAQRVLEHFTGVITAQLDGLEGMSTLVAEQQAQQQFRDDRCRHFAGREETLATIDAYLDGDENRVMALIGPGGSGKSALMAQATRRGEQRPGIWVYRFIGATPDSTLIDSVLRSITEELASALQVTESIPTMCEELVKYLAGLLGRATPEQPITIVVDALDQLTEADARRLDWLPEELPANAKFIVSAVPELEAALDKTQQIGVPLLSDEAGEVILKAWLSDVGRTLQPGQHAAVIKSFAASGLPLYLKLVFEQARHWGSTEPPPELPADIDGMIEAMLDGVEKDHTPSRILESAEVVTAPLVQTALGLLQAARYGLAENELLDVVSADEAFFNAYKQTTHHELSEARLPIAVWSRLYLDLAPYLMEREAQYVVVLGFFHRQVGDVIGQRYGSENDGQRSHAQLATYFGGQENFLDDNRRQPNGRRLGELPYQQLQCEQWQAIEATLTDFDFLMATCQAGMQGQLISDYQEAWARLQAAGHSGIQSWAEFLRDKAHIFQRSVERWGAEKILLQLACEDADESPVTVAAESWLKQGHCTWLWMRNAERPAERLASQRPKVLETDVYGIAHPSANRLFSWDWKTLKLWDLDTLKANEIGEAPRSAFLAHEGTELVAVFSDRVAWLDASSGTERQAVKWERVTESREVGLYGGIALPSGKVLTWNDGLEEAQIWNKNGLLGSWKELWMPETMQADELTRFRGYLVLDDDRLLTWGDTSGLIRVWSLVENKFIHQWSPYASEHEEDKNQLYEEDQTFTVNRTESGDILTHEYFDDNSVIKLLSGYDFSLIGEHQIDAEFAVVVPLQGERIAVLDHSMNCVPENSERTESYIYDLRANRRVARIPIQSAGGAIFLGNNKLYAWASEWSGNVGDSDLHFVDLASGLVSTIKRAHDPVAQAHNGEENMALRLGYNGALVSFSNTSKTICLWNWSSPTGEIAETRSQSKSLHCKTAPQVYDEADFESFYGVVAEKHGSKVMTADLGDGFNLEWKASPYTTEPFEIKGPISGDVRVVSKSTPDVRECVIDMESGIDCLQLLWNGTQLTCGAEYTDGNGYSEPSMRILGAVPSLRRSKGVVPRKQDEVVAIRMLSYEKYVHFHCGNFEPSFDARWEADTAYRLRCINEDGAIGLESFSDKWVWLNVYSGNRLLDAGELANLQVPNKSLFEAAIPVLKGMDAVEQVSYIKDVLDTITDRERQVLELRFGLVDGYSRTLEEVGRQFQITRERIQQIEAKTLRKMRHPTRIRKLKDFIKLPEDPKPSRSEPEKSSTASESGPAPEGGLYDLIKDFIEENADE